MTRAIKFLLIITLIITITFWRNNWFYILFIKTRENLIIFRYWPILKIFYAPYGISHNQTVNPSMMILSSISKIFRLENPYHHFSPAFLLYNLLVFPTFYLSHHFFGSFILLFSYSFCHFFPSIHFLFP